MCGIFAATGVRKAAELVGIGLHGIQHRAIDYAGMASSDGVHIYRERGPGISRQVFTREVLDRLHGMDALGHIRYPTVSDDSTRDNIQPLLGIYGDRPFALAHNGNLTNVAELRESLGHTKYSTSLDTELIVRLIEKYDSGDIEADLRVVLSLLRGSITMVLLFPDRLIAVRDKSGNRPLSIGRSGKGFFVSSETCAFANVEAEFVMDVPPGGMVTMHKGKYSVVELCEPKEQRCRFEGIYFAHPASRVFDEEVTDFRIKLGRALELAAPAIGADIVAPIPDSSNMIALGYSQSGRSGKFLPVITRNHYVGRSFIAATQAQRDTVVSAKFAFTEGLIRGKSIVVIDDSIVRGTTIPKIVKRLRELGARKVHVRIACPPILYSCTYGINTPTREELAAVCHTKSELRDIVGADSLKFMPLARLRALAPQSSKFCYACMNGVYWDRE